MGLAVLFRDGAGDVIGVAIEKLLEAEHRFDALERRQSRPSASAAFLAAATAESTSAAVESGNSAVCSPVAGLKTGAMRRDEDETLRPSMAF